MANEKRLIDANALEQHIADSYGYPAVDILHEIATFPTVDAVEVEALEAWLYQIAMNNTHNTLGGACEEIIRRLDGLRLFAKERRTDEV